MQQKQVQIDLSNQREFCKSDVEDTCARTNMHRIVRKAQIRKTRVLDNSDAPFANVSVVLSPTPAQTPGTPTIDVDSESPINTDQIDSSSKTSAVPSYSHSLPYDLEERFRNAEDWLASRGMPQIQPVPRDVYVRLKAIEDRILELEERGVTKAAKGRKRANAVSSASSTPSLQQEQQQTKAQQFTQTTSGRRVQKVAYSETPQDELTQRIIELKAKLKAKHKERQRMEQ